MLRDMLSSRLVLGALIFFVLIVGGTQLYSWHVRRGIKADEARTQQFLQHLETKKETPVVQDTGELIDTQTLGQASTPLETGGTQTMSDETDAFTSLDADGTFDGTDTFLPDETAGEDTAEVLVSPFGFGPYPEIPADYPENLIPPWAGHQNDLYGYAPGNERLDRVLIKLWNQGDKSFTGGSTANGKVYPHYPNTAYVRYKEIPLSTGTVHRQVTRIKGGPDIAPFADQIWEGIPPPHIRLIDMDKSGYNPDTFLTIGD